MRGGNPCLTWDPEPALEIHRKSLDPYTNGALHGPSENEIMKA